VGSGPKALILHYMEDSRIMREIGEIESLMRQREPELPGGGFCGQPRT
jgi:hypothetical protein